MVHCRLLGHPSKRAWSRITSGISVRRTQRSSSTASTSESCGRPRRRPEKLHADEGYGSRRNQRVLRRRRIQSRIAPPGVASSERLGRHRGVVERTIASLNQRRRLITRYERRGDIYDAFHQTRPCAHPLQLSEEAALSKATPERPEQGSRRLPTDADPDPRSSQRIHPRRCLGPPSRCEHRPHGLAPSPHPLRSLTRRCARG